MTDQLATATIRISFNEAGAKSAGKPDGNEHRGGGHPAASMRPAQKAPENEHDRTHALAAHGRLQ